MFILGLILAKNEIATTGEPYKIQPRAPGYFQNQFMPIPHSNLKIGIGINWVELG